MAPHRRWRKHPNHGRIAQVVGSAQEAIKDVHDGATLCIGTFGGKLR